MILISEFMDEGAVALLRQHHEVVHETDLPDRTEALGELIPAARALIVRNRTQVTADLLELATNLECVGRLGVGLDNIDLDACGKRGIAVFPASGANDRSVAEYVVASSMILLRGAFLSTAAVMDGKWPRQDCAGLEMEGRAIGLVGFGSIGQLVARLSAAMGMKVLASDPFLATGDPAWQLAERRELPDLLAEADVISVHVPLTAHTRHLINSESIAAMRPGAILINTARGGIVDEDAVAAALKSGRLRGAALDVFATEPVTKEYASRFANVPNLLLTPHVAGVTVDSNWRVSMMIAEKVMAHLEQSQ